MGPFPDVEVCLAHLLQDLAGGLNRVGTETPANLDTLDKYIRVHRFGGGDDGITDRPVVDIDVFAPDRATAIAVAEAARDRLLAGPHYIRDAVLDRVTTSTGPRELPWGGGDVRRWAATYRMEARRTA